MGCCCSPWPLPGRTPASPPSTHRQRTACTGLTCQSTTHMEPFTESITLRSNMPPLVHHAVHSSPAVVHHTAPVVHHATVHHAAPVVHHAVHTPHSTIFRGQLPVSVHHHVKVAEPAEVAAVEEAVEEAVVEEAVEEVEEAIAEEEVAADPVEAVDLRTPEKKEEPVVTTFVHAAPVIHHSSPVHHAVHHAAPVVHHAVHHAAPVVHHSAPVVHHAAPVVHHAAGPVVHSHQVHGGSHHGALHEVRAPVVVASAVPVRHAAHHAVHHAPAHHNVVHQVLTPFHDLMSIVRKMMPF